SSPLSWSYSCYSCYSWWFSSSRPLLPPRVVLGIDVVDRPRPLPIELEHRLALRPAKMLHPRRHAPIRPGRHLRQLLLVELAAHAHDERAGNDRQPLVLGVRVRRDAVAVGHLHPHDKGPLLRRVALQE